MRIGFCDEFDAGFGWYVDEIRRRTSHALVVHGGVWLVDPVDAPEAIERARALGEPRGVVQLLSRHNRDAAALARRFGVPHLRVPRASAGMPFELLPVVALPSWREVALWWPEGRVLVAADALGTLPYFLAEGEPLGLHPLLRVAPPRALRGLDPLHVLCGHGDGVHGPAAAQALEAAFASARRGLPRAWLRGVRFTAGSAARRLVRR